jgi:hypothetical protein
MMRVIFEIRDARIGEVLYTEVTRAYYKKVIAIHDRAGQPFRTGLEIRNGNPVKMLSLM